ncbi:hypothetical protein GCM10009662_00230 [Catellatospora coxensis]|uniref:Uncharacterized protein n=1 Tax=Catellatospora coxensis TaxID=310354 RepID=A0A8J3KZY3_9ACTN|nr:hypothetical protein Cco03nite_53390 [Catellatospora coxensis]
MPPTLLAQGQSALAEAFGSTYLVALILIVACIVPALFLPRRKIASATGQPAELALALH